MFTCTKLFNFLSIFIVFNYGFSSGYGLSRVNNPIRRFKPVHQEQYGFKSLLYSVRYDSDSYAPWVDWKKPKSLITPVTEIRVMTSTVPKSTTNSSTIKSYAPWVDWKKKPKSLITPVTEIRVRPNTVPKSTTTSSTSKSYAPWVDWKSIKSITAPSSITESLVDTKSTSAQRYIVPNTASSKSDGRSWLPWTVENSPKDYPSVTSTTSNILSYAPGSWRKRSSESVSEVATAAFPPVSTVLKSEMVKSDGRLWVPWAKNSDSKSTFFTKNTGLSVIFAEKQLNSEIQKKESVRVNDFDWSPAARASLSTMTLTSSLNQPNKFFKDVVGKAVIIKLNDGIEYRGILVCVDGYLNTAMDQTEKYENGILKAKLGSCFIDGNNVLQLEKDHNSIIYSS